MAVKTTRGRGVASSTRALSRLMYRASAVKRSDIKLRGTPFWALAFQHMVLVRAAQGVIVVCKS